MIKTVDPEGEGISASPDCTRKPRSKDLRWCSWRELPMLGVLQPSVEAKAARRTGARTDRVKVGVGTLACLVEALSDFVCGLLKRRSCA